MRRTCWRGWRPRRPSARPPRARSRARAARSTIGGGSLAAHDLRRASRVRAGLPRLRAGRRERPQPAQARRAGGGRGRGSCGRVGRRARARTRVESAKLEREQLAGRTQAAQVQRTTLDERCEQARESRSPARPSRSRAPGSCPSHRGARGPDRADRRRGEGGRAGPRGARPARGRAPRRWSRRPRSCAAEEATAEAQRAGATARGREIEDKQGPLAELFAEAQRPCSRPRRRARGWTLTGRRDELDALEARQAALRARGPGAPRAGRAAADAPGGAGAGGRARGRAGGAAEGRARPRARWRPRWRSTCAPTSSWRSSRRRR